MLMTGSDLISENILPAYLKQTTQYAEKQFPSAKRKTPVFVKAISCYNKLVLFQNKLKYKKFTLQGITNHQIQKCKIFIINNSDSIY